MIIVELLLSTLSWGLVIFLLTDIFRSCTVKGTKLRYILASIVRVLIPVGFVGNCFNVLATITTGSWFFVVIGVFNFYVWNWYRLRFNKDDDDDIWKKLKRKAKKVWAKRPRLVITVPKPVRVGI